MTDKTPPGWVTEALQRSEAQIEDGQAVPLEPVLDRLRASIVCMKSGQKRVDSEDRPLGVISLSPEAEG